jgi:RNA-binding protein 48
MEIQLHHIKQKPCLTRPIYRDGKKPKVMKVYTCNQESIYIIVTNIPSIGVHNELLKLFTIYGEIVENKMLDEYPCKNFCETMLIKFLKIENAR